MTDMLVKLYSLPNAADACAALAHGGVTVRRALVPEKPIVVDFVVRRYPAWAAEVEASFARMPVACFVALRAAQVVGFACHDAFARNFFGPSAVDESERGRGVGRALLVAALGAMRDAGYAYAIIGGAGPREFYERAVGAIAIDDSTPGPYAGMLKAPRPR